MADLAITARTFQPSKVLNKIIHKRFKKLARLMGPTRKCEVVLDQPHRSRRKGATVALRLEVFGQGKPIVVTRESSEVRVEAIVSEAFQTIEHRLREQLRHKSNRPRDSLRRAA